VALTDSKQRFCLDVANRITIAVIGEWHSHPDGHPQSQAMTTANSLLVVAGYTKSRWLSPVMLIVGESELRWFVEPLEPARDFNGLLIVTGEAPLEPPAGCDVCGACEKSPATVP